jgi:hypothetical protein
MYDKLPVYVVDAVAEMVAAADAVLFPTLQKHITYIYDRPDKITALLKEYTESIKQKDKKYPLVALFQDFPEDRGETDFYSTTVIPKIIIATGSDQSWKSPQRYEANFKPVLYPIYYELLKQIASHRLIVTQDPNDIVHRKWDRPGTLPAAPGFNDFIDAIELQNTKLSFKKQDCK